MAKIKFEIDIDDRRINTEIAKEAKVLAQQMLEAEFFKEIKNRRTRIEGLIDSAIREEARLFVKNEEIKEIVRKRMGEISNEEILTIVNNDTLQKRIDEKISQLLQKLVK